MKTLLPSHRAAIQKEIDKISAERLENIDLNKITTLPQFCDAKLLPFLAFSFDVDISNLKEQEARNLIGNAFSLHFYAGTKFALRTALESIFSATKIIEWFEYDGKPYHFKVDIDATDGVDNNIYQKIDRAIEKYKNVRSVLEAIRIFLSSHGEIYFAAAAVGGEDVTIYPYYPTSIESDVVIYFAAGLHAVESMIIQPKQG